MTTMSTLLIFIFCLLPDHVLGFPDRPGDYPASVDYRESADIEKLFKKLKKLAAKVESLESSKKSLTGTVQSLTDTVQSLTDTVQRLEILVDMQHKSQGHTINILTEKQKSQGSELSMLNEITVYNFKSSQNSLTDKVQRLETSLNMQQEKQENKIEALTEKQNKLAKKDMEHDTELRKQGNLLTDLSTSLSTQADELGKLEKAQLEPLKIIKSPGKQRPAECAFTCAGTSGWDDTVWTDYKADTAGYLYTKVDISKCAFVQEPIITVSINGVDSHGDVIGASAVYSAKSTSFRVNLQGYVKTTFILQTAKPSASFAKSYRWNIVWSAFGYRC